MIHASDGTLPTSIIVDLGPLNADWELSEAEASELLEIGFTGGDPLLRQDDIVRNAMRSDNLSCLRMRMVTNGTVPFGQGLTDLMCLSERTQLVFSVDGYGDLNEYVRSSGSWKSLRKSLMRIDDLSLRHRNIEYGITSALSVLNCNMLHELWQWYESCLYNPDRRAEVIPLLDPGFLDASNLPDGFKQRTVAMLEAESSRAHPRTSALMGRVVDHMCAEPKAPFGVVRDEFNRFRLERDAACGTRLAEVNPDIADLFG